jgi:hypothetical protein
VVGEGIQGWGGSVVGGIAEIDGCM